MISHSHDSKRGMFLVAGSAVAWSFGGMISRSLSVTDSWTVVFWRSVFAALFLFGFMVWRDGLGGTFTKIKSMGRWSFAVALCFAIASSSFVISLAYTTVANVLLIQAGVPLIAALLTRILFHEKISRATWVAIAAVIVGVAIMVSESFTGNVSPIGDSLAILIAFVFATATVITRRHSDVQMTPAVCIAVIIAASFAFTMTGGLAVSTWDFGLLVAFGALNLGLGLALFVIGARNVPAALAALIGTIEPVLAPLWVWLVHHEVPSNRTLIGGAVVFVALLMYLLLDWRRQRR